MRSRRDRTGEQRLMDMTTTVGRYMVFYHNAGSGRGGTYSNSFDTVGAAIGYAEGRKQHKVSPAYVMDRKGWKVVHEFD